MRSLRLSLLLPLLALPFAALCPRPLAAAGAYSHVFVFGDSLSDPGNIPRLTGVDFPPPPYSAHRFSNGPTYAELLPPLLGLPLRTADNYAVGGAQSGRANLNSNRAEYGLAGVTLPGVQDEVDTYLAQHPTADPTALYVVFAGANDLFGALAAAGGAGDLAQGRALARQIAGNAALNVAATVQRLAATGAQQFLVLNLPDLGRTPLAAAAGPKAPGVLTRLTLLFNRRLAGQLRTLTAQASLTITQPDVFRLDTAFLDQPARFGLTDVVNKAIDSAATAQGDLPGENTFFYWDNVHPTTVNHGTLAAYVASVLRRSSFHLPAAVGETVP